METYIHAPPEEENDGHVLSGVHEDEDDILHGLGRVTTTDIAHTCSATGPRAAFTHVIKDAFAEGVKSRLRIVPVCV